MVELIAIGLLFSVFMCTILHEIKLFERFFEKLPMAMQFVPMWSFFAPNPYQSDYYILFRTISSKNLVGAWKQAHYYEKPKYLYSCFWNPGKWFKKGIIDLAMDLCRISTATKNKAQICLSTPYLSILNYVQSFDLDSDAEKIQFLIMSRSKQNIEMNFLSEAHSLAPLSSGSLRPTKPDDLDHARKDLKCLH